VRDADRVADCHFFASDLDQSFRDLHDSRDGNGAFVRTSEGCRKITADAQTAATCLGGNVGICRQ
jgi:hypothetical protein